jgi:hypothetical protein
MANNTMNYITFYGNIKNLEKIYNNFLLFDEEIFAFKDKPNMDLNKEKDLNYENYYKLFESDKSNYDFSEHPKWFRSTPSLWNKNNIATLDVDGLSDCNPICELVSMLCKEYEVTSVIRFEKDSKDGGIGIEGTKEYNTEGICILEEELNYDEIKLLEE